ncbi:MAG: DNA N-6-adenine-methyltransferase [Ignavibacteria bacterium]
MKVHYSSEKQNWETPQDFFDKINKIFNFTLDSCTEIETAKCEKFFTKEEDALVQDWKGVVWCNPPYGREQVKFVKKALDEHNKYESTVVILIPARPDTKLWQDVIFPNASQVCFVRGRLRFGNSKDNAPFPCALVVFSKEKVELSDFGYCIK